MRLARLPHRLRLRLAGPLGRRSLFEAVGVAIVCALCALLLDRGGGLTRAEGIVYDAFMSIRARPAPDDRIVVVAIDNPSLRALGRWPWPRDLHARLIDRLAGAGAAAVALDVLLVEPSPADAALAAALAHSGRVCLPLAVEAAGPDGAPWGEQRPVPILAAAAAGVGQVNLSPDGDGVVRRLPLELQAPGRTWPHLVSCTLKVAGMTPTRPPVARPETSGALEARTVGLTYPRSQGAFRTVARHLILEIGTLETGAK